MEKKKTFFDYGAQVFIVFGFTMAVMHVFVRLFGQSAKEFSSLFQLGGQGIATETALQFFGLSILIVFFRILFFTDIFIRRMRIGVRTVCMLAAVLLTIVLFVAVFDWFPVHMWECWLMFALCFGISFAVSLSVTVFKEKMENKQMEKALQKLKQSKEW